MSGKLIGIAHAAELRAPMEEAQTAAVSVETGIAGDARGRKWGGVVCVVFGVGWVVGWGVVGVCVGWVCGGGFLYVEGINRPRSVGGRISIGDVVLEVTQETKPCMLMEQFHTGLKGALTPDWRAGVCCDVISGGEIHVGDTVSLS
jgi:hypothetical protein